MSAEGKIVRGSPPDPELAALVRALARADAEDDVERRYGARAIKASELGRRLDQLSELLREPFKAVLLAQPNPHHSTVYFMRAGTGPIKIGCSCNPERRRLDLQTASGEKLSILATVPGGRDGERYLHGCFADDRLEGEWFHPSPRLLGFIAELRQ